MRNWIGGFLTATLLIGIGIESNVIVSLKEEIEKLKGTNLKEEEE